VSDLRADAAEARCLARCRDGVGSGTNGVTAGARYGPHCLGCSAGLMVVLLALGAMSVTWMLVMASASTQP
jgi:predicted metal-binding membrane protein